MPGFCSLASGSSGNSSVLKLAAEYFLIDAGISLKKIVTHLNEQGLAPEQITRLLITHAHSDHAKSAGLFARKYNTPIYLTRETFQALKNKGYDLSDCQVFFLQEKENFGGVQVQSFRLPHLGHSPNGSDDAGGAIGFLFSGENLRIGYFTDLGTMPEHIIKDIQDCDFLFLEANHDVRWQKSSRRPAQVIERNLSDFGHLSNEQSARIVERVVKKGGRTKAVMLGHISRECNSHELIKKAFKKIEDLPLLFALENRCSEYVTLS